MKFEVYTYLDDYVGEFDSLKEAKAFVKRQKLDGYSIWSSDGLRAEHAPRSAGMDDRAKQGLGMANESERVV